MSRGYFLKVSPVDSSGESQEFLVTADGWDGVARKQPAFVGRLYVTAPSATYTFTPSGEWADGSIVPRVEAQPLAIDPTKPIFHRWLVQAAMNWLNAQDGSPRLLFYI